VAESGRLIEARVDIPRGERQLVYDIGLSGFVSDAPLDFAVLREFCRPGDLVSVTEEAVRGVGFFSAELYSPRKVVVTCSP
jgi:hypothetical protein